ncbi:MULTISPECIES: hypothetical protein [unclassified Streptomyces]|uniref:hypothetical protein n=1 Tax=unclassified Streptomyces TaxID=2593676 RepID=UPI001BEA77A9|nr:MULTISPECIES: hypothetical protein [unclassified Streptomyces]
MGPCADVDTTRGQHNLEFSAALSRGKTYLGRRSLAGQAPGPYVWRDLTRASNPGYPRHACGVSVSTEGNRVFVKVLTTSGDVYENTCTYTPNGALHCNQGWTALVKP